MYNARPIALEASALSGWRPRAATARIEPNDLAGPRTALAAVYDPDREKPSFRRLALPGTPQLALLSSYKLLRQRVYFLCQYNF